MRIAFVLSGLGTGGAEKIVNLLAHHRLSRGDAVSVIAVNAGTPDSYFPYDRAIEIHALAKGASGPLGVLLRTLALRRRLRRFKPDIVISFLTKINVQTGLAATGLGVPFVLSERNNFLTQEMSPFWRRASPIVARRAKCLVMQTREACRSLPEDLWPKVTIIPNPVALPENWSRTPGDGSRIVAVGRLDRQKGFDLLLQAFANIAGSLPAVTLTIFGEGAQRTALERQVQDLGLGDRVRLPGVTKSPVDWISAGDIFVLSSRFEGFPNAVLEAMTAGLATIAFDCPWGPSEILDGPDAGLLVPAGDVLRLGEAIRNVATDPALRHLLADAGARTAASRYATAPVLARWDAVIAQALGQTTRPDAAPSLHAGARKAR
ncbi:glycosyltransferase [Sinorhizobium sp. BG8]|uniref:glycosyltransferase n=1 Tax=Sinorhizobium sp. BG8 TaxID=2613773 RepID=UPI00193E24B1|nr:glycosyltransferase [Sinorhizobium sp. BG8]